MTNLAHPTPPPQSATEVALRPTPPGVDEPDSTGGCITKDRAHDQVERIVAENLKSLSKVEIAPDDDDASRVTRTDEECDVRLGDEVYREVAAEYERRVRP